MAKKIIYNEEARSKLMAGVFKISEAVKVTLGPCGRLVMLEKPGSSPIVTKDGVTVAKEIDLQDPFENLGAQLLKEVASKTNDVAGDNTTTATVLAYSIVKEGMKAVSSGSRPMEIKRGIDHAVRDITTKLASISKEVNSPSEIMSVATISANNDPEIGELLSKAIEQVGKDGIITVENSKDMTSSIKIVDGLDFDKGWINPNFCNNKERQMVEYENAKVLITDQKISSFQEILPIADAAVNASAPLLIICGDMDGEALGTLILNSIRGSIKVAVVKAPSYGQFQKAVLSDIAVFTGGTFFDSDICNVKDATLDMLGTANFKSTKENTTLTNGGGDKEEIKNRINELKSLYNSSEGLEKTKFKNRLAKLDGGVAVIYIGGATVTEMTEKRFRIEDTIAATRAALEEGIIPGGGVALINAADKLQLDSSTANYTEDLNRGYEIVLKAVEEPLKQIAENAGVNGEVVLNEIKKLDKGYGYNARTDKYVDMMKDGVIDTTKAIKNALLNAASIAGSILTTECCAIEDPDTKEKAQLMATPMGMLPA